MAAVLDWREIQRWQEGNACRELLKQGRPACKIVQCSNDQGKAADIPNDASNLNNRRDDCVVEDLRILDPSEEPEGANLTNTQPRFQGDAGNFVNCMMC